MSRFLHAPLSAAALLLLAAPSWAATAHNMLGRWYLEGEENGSYIQYLVTRSSDGTFTAEIRSHEGCAKTSTWTERGRWEYRDGTLYNQTEAVDGEEVEGDNEDFRDAFTITVVDKDRLRAVDMETKSSWLTERVGAKFTFPPRAKCSV